MLVAVAIAALDALPRLFKLLTLAATSLVSIVPAEVTVAIALERSEMSDDNEACDAVSLSLAMSEESSPMAAVMPETRVLMLESISETREVTSRMVDDSADSVGCVSNCAVARVAKARMMVEVRMLSECCCWLDAVIWYSGAMDGLNNSPD